jgi:hypothetical protein
MVWLKSSNTFLNIDKVDSIFWEEQSHNDDCIMITAVCGGQQFRILNKHLIIGNKPRQLSIADEKKWKERKIQHADELVTEIIELIESSRVQDPSTIIDVSKIHL